MRRTGQDGPHLDGTGQEHARLEAYHLDILLLGYIIALFEVHVVLLSLAYLQCGFGAEVEHRLQFVAVALQHLLIGEHQHRVAGEDGCIVAPPFVHGDMPPSQVGLVHQVIV